MPASLNRATRASLGLSSNRPRKVLDGLCLEFPTGVRVLLTPIPRLVLLVKRRCTAASAQGRPCLQKTLCAFVLAENGFSPSGCLLHDGRGDAIIFSVSPQ